MLNRNFLKALFLFVCNLSLVILFTASAGGSTPKPVRILITPLWFHSPEDLTFLNRGILEMLATRLPRQGAIDVLQGAKAPRDDNDALKMALKQEAGYVLTGGVTLFDNTISTDVRLLDTGSGRIALRFSRFGRRPGDVLAHIDALSTQIVNLLTRGEAQAGPADDARAQPAAPAPRPVKQQIVPPRAKAGPAGWRSQPLDLAVDSLAAADIDGKDGTDLALAGDRQIRIMALAGQTLTPLAQWKIPAYERILSVDAADLNGNGPAELYVTCLDQHQRLKSFVLEWRDGRLNTILKNFPWFMRVIRAPDGTPRLIGQKQKLLGSDSAFEMRDADPFLKGIYTMTWRKGGLRADALVNAPDTANVFGLNMGPLVEPGRITLVAYDDHDRIRLFSNDGRKQWHGSDPFGGSETFLKIPGNLSKNETGRFYLPHRLLVTDLNRDTRGELVAASNNETGKRLLTRYRRYTQGKVILLAWDGATMTPVWETAALEGYISDMAVIQPDGDQPASLILALVDKDKNEGTFGGRKTWIVVQAIDANRLTF